MFDFKILEIAIGLIFIYLLLSLLATSVNEFIMRFFYSRGKNLKRAIKRMLEDSPQKGTSATKADEEDKGPPEKNQNGSKHGSLADEFYDHPLIEKFSNPSFWGQLFNKKLNKPSYLSNKTFSKVLLEVLGDTNEGNVDFDKIKEKINDIFPKQGKSSTRDLLLKLVDDAQGKLDRLKADLENWYEQMMERASGWYKRRVQVFLLAFGFVISIIFNADSIRMAGTLSSDPEARAVMIQMAENYVASMKESQQAGLIVAQGADSTSMQVKSDSILYYEIMQLVNQDIPEAGSIMGMGWKFPGEDIGFWDMIKFIFRSSPTHILGWLITTFAIALGAPFWFDILGKVINIRNAGRKPEDKTSSGQQPVG